ncbi:hypothetical protein O181_030123 [Austropuccinia psidii MF-1]|uniref:Uncharacterized protein n=1 Tax=Austropuccinia psidii MF-1 TaxID=1389203 RepID=A0A9Q3CX47_9BASI|nr:hypothetical protein [Austropuccinia psidii MF-1]
MSRIGDWVERAYIHVYRRGLASRPLDQLASYPASFDTLQELIDITLELDTRYHERQKEKGSHQEKKPPVTGFNSSRPPHKKNKKGKKFQASKDKPHSALLNKEDQLIGSEKERRIKKGYVPLVVESTQLKNASRGLTTNLGHQEASLSIREKAEWES